jgi:hypothetical protein
VSPALRRGLGLAAALAVMAAMVALSRAPYVTGQGADALLRLSWSGRPQRIEKCRELSDAELAERPAHMRRRLECEGRPASYVVRVAVDGRTASLDTVTGGGLRGDRAIHMLREIGIEPGSRTIAVEMRRVETIEDEDDHEDEDEQEDEAPDSGPRDRAVREREERSRERQEALPPRLELARPVTLAPGSVALVTYDASSRRLVLLQQAATADR